VGTTPEFARLVIANASQFCSGWPDNVRAVVGKKAFMFRDGPEHTNVKKILQKTLLPESLKTQVAPMEAIILRHLNEWANNGNCVAKNGAKKVGQCLHFLYGEFELHDVSRRRKLDEDVDSVLSSVQFTQ
jgi:hypothetical protein